MNENPTVSVIMVTWNSGDVIAACLRSLHHELPSGQSEIIIIDNASSDDTVEVARVVAPDATIIVNSENRGLAAANNQGIVRASGTAFLICNPDVIFGPASVRNLMTVLEKNDAAAWVVPRLYDPDGTVLTSAGDLPTFGAALLGRQAARQRSLGEPSGFWWDGWGHDVTRPIGRGHECAYLVRRRAVEEVGLQDERFVLDWEGIDWTERFRRAGWEVWLSSHANVVHMGGASIRQVPFRAVASQHRGMYLYFSDRHAAIWKPLLVGVFTLRAAAKMAATGVGIPLYAWAHRGRGR
jgi:GT2 family glycosyltransferase